MNYPYGGWPPPYWPPQYPQTPVQINPPVLNPNMSWKEFREWRKAMKKIMAEDAEEEKKKDEGKKKKEAEKKGKSLPIAVYYVIFTALSPFIAIGYLHAITLFWSSLR